MPPEVFPGTTVRSPLKIEQTADRPRFGTARSHTGSGLKAAARFIGSAADVRARDISGFPPDLRKAHLRERSSLTVTSMPAKATRQQSRAGHRCFAGLVLNCSALALAEPFLWRARRPRRQKPNGPASQLPYPYPGAGSPNGAPVVFLPGATDSCRAFLAAMRRTPSGYRVADFPRGDAIFAGGNYLVSRRCEAPHERLSRRNGPDFSAILL